MVPALDLPHFKILLKLDDLAVLIVALQAQFLPEPRIVPVVFSLNAEKGSDVGNLVECSDVLKL